MLGDDATMLKYSSPENAARQIIQCCNILILQWCTLNLLTTIKTLTAYDIQKHKLNTAQTQLKRVRASSHHRQLRNTYKQANAIKSTEIGTISKTQFQIR